MIFLLFLHQIQLKSQHQNNNWFFGRNAGMTFNTTPPSPIYSELITSEGTACISDPLGNLLFYTDGITVWDRNHDTMPNGTGLMGGFSSTQSALIVPFPFSTSKYYIFTTPMLPLNYGLNFSIVDMQLNNGFGDVVADSKNTLLLENIGEKVTSVLHANGHDVWVITHTRNSNDFYAFLVSQSGITPIPVISSLGSFYPADAFIGHIKPSQKGDKIVVSNTQYFMIDMFDFNRATGELSNFYSMNELLPPFPQIYGIEFSQNDSLLYLTEILLVNNNTIYQIELSSEVVTVLDQTTFDPKYGALRSGPDGKIYLARPSAEYIDVIHHPNLAGLDCNYDDRAIEFPENIRSASGLPSHCLYSFFLPNTQILGSDTTLCSGQTLELNIDISKDCAPIHILWNDGSTGFTRTIDQPGTYWVTLESICGNVTDTIQVDFVPCLPIVYYALDSCESYMSNGTHMDYAEFTPEYPSGLTCADITATNVFRSPPQENKHSCTPGINANEAMCISSYPLCTYDAGHSSSLIMEVQINPLPDSIVMLTGLEFFEKAPDTYNWIDGPSGPNNYPTKYGFRVLKNESEIYRTEDISTSTTWTLQSFDFLNDTAFRITQPSLFRFELLPYCPVGNGAEVSAWDIDEIRIYGGCGPLKSANADLSGTVITKAGQGIPDVEMQLSAENTFSHPITATTNTSGEYSFPPLESGQGYFIKGYKNNDVLNGVSAIDLIIIQKHLLGITPFTSLHQYVAADINHDGRVSALDLIQLQKLLLGITSEFPSNTSWRFGYLPQDMGGQDLSSFKEVYNIETLNPGNISIHFTGIKIGDLNGDAKL
jgi:hypothetical protein